MKISIQLTKEQKTLFEKAAYLKGYKNLNDFVLSVIKEEVNTITSDKNTISLTQTDSEIFFSSLAKPKKPNKTLKTADKKYKSE